MYPVLSRIIKNADYLTLIAKFPDENVIAQSIFIFYQYVGNSDILNIFLIRSLQYKKKKFYLTFIA